MIFKTDGEIRSLVKAFEERTLPKDDWTHAAHLTIGLYYCLNCPFAVAKNWMSDCIHWLNDSHGTPNTESSGYHETLTYFWLKTISNFLEKCARGESLTDLANELILSCSDTRLPLKFYSRELLFSTEARTHLVKPDLDNLAPGEAVFLGEIANKSDFLQRFFPAA